MCSTGLSFSVVPAPESAEPRPARNEKPVAFALRSASGKGKSLFLCAGCREQVQSGTGVSPEECLIISADTVVVLNDRILGKPADCQEAFEHLTSLNNTDHSVVTACSLFFEGREVQFSVSSTVTFGDNAPDLLRAYADTGEGLDKAGAYAIQGRGATLIRSIAGSWTGVVGLPLAELMHELQAHSLVTVGTVPR